MAGVEVTRSEGPTVTQADRLAIGHAMAQWAAERAGIRVLHIKGLAAQAVLPLERTSGGDVDILVDPPGFKPLLDILSAVESCQLRDDGSRSSTAHAVEVANFGLSVSLDVHRHFPGFVIDHAAAFEVLWQRSVELEMAGWSIRALDRPAAVVLALAHGARNAESSGVQQKAMARWEQLTEAEKVEVEVLAQELHAQAALQVATGLFPNANRWEVALFVAHQEKASPATLWVLSVIATRGLAGRLAVVRRALFGRGPAGESYPTTATSPARGSRAAALVRSVGPLIRELRSALRGQAGLR